MQLQAAARGRTGEYRRRRIHPVADPAYFDDQGINGNRPDNAVDGRDQERVPALRAGGPAWRTGVPAWRAVVPAWRTGAWAALRSWATASRTARSYEDSP